MRCALPVRLRPVSGSPSAPLPSVAYWWRATCARNEAVPASGSGDSSGLVCPNQRDCPAGCRLSACLYHDKCAVAVEEDVRCLRNSERLGRIRWFVRSDGGFEDAGGSDRCEAGGDPLAPFSCDGRRFSARTCGHRLSTGLGRIAYRLRLLYWNSGVIFPLRYWSSWMADETAAGFLVDCAVLRHQSDHRTPCCQSLTPLRGKVKFLAVNRSFHLLRCSSSSPTIHPDRVMPSLIIVASRSSATWARLSSGSSSGQKPSSGVPRVKNFRLTARCIEN